MDRFYNDVATRTDESGRRLSDRLWGNSRRTRETIDTILRDGIRDGASVDDIARELTSWVRPGISGGKAHYAATRLAGNETRRAHNLSQQAVALTDPAGGFLRYTLNRTRHIAPHDCDEYAAHDEGYGRGVWPARSIPLPPQHPGCRCNATRIEPAARNMDAFVDKLRIEYGLDDPPDLSPEDLAIFRRETAGVRRAVQMLFRAWLDQTGLVTTEQLAASSPTVREWVARVKREKAERRGR